MAEVRGTICPICKKASRPSDPFFPFCSKRCKLVDLGAWLDERYRIQRPLREGDVEPGTAAEPSPGPSIEGSGAER